MIKYGIEPGQSIKPTEDVDVPTDEDLLREGRKIGGTQTDPLMAGRRLRVIKRHRSVQEADAEEANA